jgi:hypothetical protein
MPQTLNLLSPAGDPLAVAPWYADLSEVPLPHYVGFTHHLKALEAGEDDTASRPDPLLTIARAVSEFYGVDLIKVFQAQIGDFEAMTDPAREYVGETLASLYGRAIGLLKRFTPDPKPSFTYRDETFLLPDKRDLNVIETVEALEAERVVHADIAESGDATGAKQYTLYLKTLSVFARAEGEETLPESDTERERVLNDSTLFFSGRDLATGERIDTGIDTATALNVDFFLSGLWKGSAKIPAAIGSLSRPALLRILEATLRRTRKPSRPRKTTMQPSSAASVGGS